MTLPAVTGSVLGDIETWVRRIIKSPSSQAISPTTIADYINRFYVYDVPERIQLFELKRQYTFETIPNIFMYQFPFDQYQGLREPVYCDGVQIGFFMSNQQFYNVFPELVLNEQPIQGDGTAGPYTVTFGQSPILRGFKDDLGNLLPYVYITALNATNNQVYVVDDGEGNLLQTDASFQFDPSGTTPIYNINTGILDPSVVCGTVDYEAGTATFTLDTGTVPSGNVINTQTSPYSAGVPRLMLFFNNTIKLYPVPDRAYKIQADAYITPTQFLTTNAAIPFAYMSEYIARGAARKILSDSGDVEQLQFYEPFFREQENLVLRRTSRQNATQRTPTIFSAQTMQNPYLYSQY